MADYEAEVARQSGAPFNRQERKTVRRVAEHWLERRRYSEERKRRLSSYGWWIGLAVPILISAIKIVEAIFGK